MSLSVKRRKELEMLVDKNIDYSDIPELNEEFWQKAQVTMPSKKKAISLRLDETVLDWFKQQGKGYQSRINAVLSSYVKSQIKSMR